MVTVTGWGVDLYTNMPSLDPTRYLQQAPNSEKKSPKTFGRLTRVYFQKNMEKRYTLEIEINMNTVPKIIISLNEKNLFQSTIPGMWTISSLYTPQRPKENNLDNGSLMTPVSNKSPEKNCQVLNFYKNFDWDLGK